jgi:putative FmdB family regulatory protein
MPTYEYACTSCGQRLEVVQSFSDEPLTTCALCGGPLRKVFGAVGIVLKGSGFYKTDSRSSGSKSGGEAPAKSGSDGESAKPAAAKESAPASGSSAAAAPAGGAAPAKAATT